MSQKREPENRPKRNAPEKDGITENKEKACIMKKNKKKKAAKKERIEKTISTEKSELTMGRCTEMKLSLVQGFVRSLYWCLNMPSKSQCQTNTVRKQRREKYSE